MAMNCDLLKKQCAMLVAIDRFDLVAVLDAIGVRANLGKFDLVIRQVRLMTSC